MKFFIRILAGVAVVAFGVVMYLMFNFYESSVEAKNYIRTMAARAARHSRKETDDVENPSTTKPGSEGVIDQPVIDQQNLNTSENEKMV